MTIAYSPLTFAVPVPWIGLVRGAQPETEDGGHRAECPLLDVLVVTAGQDDPERGEHQLIQEVATFGHALHE
jgi:hypothetical protein